MFVFWKNLTYFVFLWHLFWDSPFCFITDELCMWRKPVSEEGFADIFIFWWILNVKISGTLFHVFLFVSFRFSKYKLCLYALMSNILLIIPIHCVKSVQIRSYFWFVFSCIRTEYRKIRTRNNSVLGRFSRNDSDKKQSCTCILTFFSIKDNIQAVFNFFRRSSMQFTIRILKHMFTSNMNCHIFTSMAL